MAFISLKCIFVVVTYWVGYLRLSLSFMEVSCVCVCQWPLCIVFAGLRTPFVGTIFHKVLQVSYFLLWESASHRWTLAKFFPSFYLPFGYSRQREFCSACPPPGNARPPYSFLPVLDRVGQRNHLWFLSVFFYLFIYFTSQRNAVCKKKKTRKKFSCYLRKGFSVSLCPY